MLGLAMAILALATTVSSSLFGDAALGDPIPPLSAVGFALWVGCIALFFGGLAFALGPLLGRAGAAGVAGLAMILLWLANGLDTLAAVAPLSPFRWTADHIALVGQFDWAPLALVGMLRGRLPRDRGAAVRTARPGGHRRALPAAAAGHGPRRPRSDQPRVR